MYCTNCGKQNADDVAFCFNCGEPLHAAEDTAPNGSASGAMTMPDYGISSNLTDGNYNEKSEAASRVFAKIKTLLSSNMFLIVAILMSAGLVLTMFAQYNYVQGGGMNQMMHDILDRVHESDLFNGEESEIIDEAFDEIMESIENSSTRYSFSLPIGTVVLLIGLWLLYADAKKRDSLQVNARGMNVLRILTLIELILVCIGCGLIGVVALLVSIFAIGAIPAGAIAIFFLIVAGVMAFIIVYYAKLYTTLKSINSTMNNGIYNDKVSMFAAVVTIVFGSIGALSALGSPYWLLIIAELTSSAGSILMGAMLIKYRNGMREVTGTLI
ncbi:MAG: zinc-ribbon domain-containing protein [Christensenellaceae bacterium]|nr:zinc-ribbon domain-containing protein [Christensenellaceae bacterium]